MSSPISAELLNRYAQLVRDRWEDNAVEALIGVLSTVITEAQLEVLIANTENQLKDLK